MEWQPCKVLVAVKNLSNYKDDDKSYVKLIQSKARGQDLCQLYESILTEGIDTVQR